LAYIFQGSPFYGISLVPDGRRDAMPIIKASSKGQVVIPAQLRRKYQIDKGTKLNVLDGDGEIILRPVLQNAVQQARGLFRGGVSSLQELVKERREGGIG
jgi:AbrB family looped-hinge helix DNA binding protein